LQNADAEHEKTAFIPPDF